MSRSVRRTEVLPVAVCPTVQSKQRFHPWKESIRPLGVHALDCSILRWLSPCFLPMRSCFYPWSFAREPTETRFNCQGARCMIAHNGTNVNKTRISVPAGSASFIPRLKDGAGDCGFIQHVPDPTFLVCASCVLPPNRSRYPRQSCLLYLAPPSHRRENAAGSPVACDLFLQLPSICLFRY